MTHKLNSKQFEDLLQKAKEFALVVGEECPEKHRRDPGSGRCLPVSSIDHTEFTRSVNDDQGDFWRGLKDKDNETFDDDRVADRASQNREEALLDASEMDELESCSEGHVFSFVQKKCITLEEAEREDAGEYAFEEEGQNGHEDVIAKDPEGRRDTVNFQCPPNQFFDHKRRECIPLNKDTVMAAIDGLPEEEKAVYLSGRLGITTPDPLDGHYHLVTVDEEGNGKTSVSNSYHGERAYYHSHDVAEYMVKDFTEGGYTSRHFGHVIPRNLYEYEDMQHAEEVAQPASSEVSKELKSKQRTALPDSAFGVPGKRKFPLHDCSHVRNAMARFNQAKGLTSGEKATLRRKILSRAKACNIEVENFAKATSEEDFDQVLREMLMTEDRVRQAYSAEEEAARGPCPPGMVWDMKMKKCMKAKGFVDNVLNRASHSEIIAKDPEGRRDTPGFQCPPGQVFDFARRECIPLNKDTVMASDDSGASRDLAPSPKGRPARLPQDCPKGTIWDADLEKCKPLDSRQKTKSEDESGQKAPSGPGKDKDSKGCGPGEFFNPITKKCMPLPSKFKKSKSAEQAVHAQPGNREGLTDAVPGKVKLPSDCPPGTIWDGTRRTCTPLSTEEKTRQGSPGPYNPKDLATVDKMSTAQLIKYLDQIIKEELASGRGREKADVAARDLPNEAFPPSLVSSTRRSLLHHNPNVEDAYDNQSVNVSRLRNSLARVSSLQGYSEMALEEATQHLLYHAREVVKAYLGKG